MTLLSTPAILVQDCSRSPDEVNAERNAARTVQHQENDLQKLRDRVSVLAHAKETDARRFRQIAVERQREREELRREVDSLKVCPFCQSAAACHSAVYDKLACAYVMTRIVHMYNVVIGLHVGVSSIAVLC